MRRMSYPARFDPMLRPPYGYGYENEPEDHHDLLVILGDDTGVMRLWPRASNIDRISLKLPNSCLQAAAMQEPCSICLEEPDKDTIVRYTRCGHVFGAKCFEEWYRRAQRCPLCNADLC